MKIKYVFQKTVVGWNWHPVIDDQVLFYPHGTLNGVRQFVDTHIDDIQDYLNSDDNYGLSFYVCGYDGDVKEWAREDKTDSVRVTFKDGRTYFSSTVNVVLYND